jgi:hypothetical protein
MTEPSPPTGALPARVPPGSLPLPDRFELPAPPGTVPLPNVFPAPLTYVDDDRLASMCADAIEQLPVATEAILPAHDREVTVRILRAPNRYICHVLEGFLDNLYENSVVHIKKDIVTMARHQRELDAMARRQRERGIAPRFARRTQLTRWIARIQERVDEHRDRVATSVRDNLALIQEYNQDLYERFCEDWLTPHDIEKGVSTDCSIYMKDVLLGFCEYASYATHATLIRILDRVAYGLETTMYLYPVRMQPPYMGEWVPGSNYHHQMHNIRDALTLVAADPRAAPVLEYSRLGVHSNTGPYGMHVTDFNFFAAHMVRRARDRAWERVRDRFADRLASWAQRYPESRLAALNHNPDVTALIAAFRFPYTPYPN